LMELDEEPIATTSNNKLSFIDALNFWIIYYR